MNKDQNKKTVLERAAGSLGTNIAATLVVASGGGYLAPLLPVLLNSLASKRYQDRVANALQEIDTQLNELKSEVENLSDAQFKLISEMISAVIHTTDEDKLKYLVETVPRCVSVAEIEDSEATIISRMLRDISMAELRFMLSIISLEEIVLANPDPSRKETIDWISPKTREAELLSGLVSLGIVIPTSGGTFGTLHYRFSPVAKYLKRIIPN